MAEADLDDPFSVVGTTLAGRFEVHAPIAAGGFGVVYRGRQVTLDRPVALKILRPPTTLSGTGRDAFLDGFIAEGKIIARISHPNIVQVYDFGVSVLPSGERAAWMALEWLTGVTLEADLAARRGAGGRTPAETLQLLRPVLAALAVVHAAGVAHRDLKPANVMLVPSPTGTTPKVVDFGIAKVMEEGEAPGQGHTVTRSSMVAFSPGYASPEQISHARSGPWTDVHALGLLLTELLIDQSPLDSTEATLLFQQIMDRVRPTPGKFGIAVGPWEAVLAKAMAVVPAARYRDAGELLRALEAGVVSASETSRARLRSIHPPSAASALDHVGGLPTVREPHADAPRMTTTAATALQEPPTLVSTPRRRARAIPLGLPLVALLGLVVVAGFLARSSRAPDSAAAPPVGVTPGPLATTFPAVVPLPAPAPPLPAESASTVPAPDLARAAPPTPQSSAAPGTAKPPKTGAPPRRSVTVNCDPPFTVDGLGRTHYKPECDN